MKQAGREKLISVSLRVVVFLCGAVVMAVEIMGSRVLAPFFGSDIFVWGSLIGVVLLALSLGYYFGGKLADKIPRFAVLGGIILVAGFYLLALPFFSSGVCETVRKGTSFGGGASPIPPLVACLVLFLFPGVLLGTVSPFAIKLATRSLSTVGGVAGSLYALSTVGSILGTMATAFILVSVARTSVIIVSLGGVLVAVGLLAVVSEGYAGGSRTPLWLIALLLLSAGFLAWMKKPLDYPVPQGENATVVTTASSPYHNIVVVRSRDYTGRWRLDLHFDKYIESAIYLNEEGNAPAEPFEAATDYTDLLHLPVVFRKDIERVLFVGGGGGVAPTLFLKHYPEMKIDVVEIDPEVVRIAKKYFGFEPFNDRTRTFIMDGRNYIRQTRESYDLIIFDAFTTGGRPPFHLLTKECLELAYERVGPRGIVLSNIISDVRGKRSRLFRSEFKTYCEVFAREKVYIFPKQLRGGNIIIVGTKFQRRFDKSTLRERATRLRRDGILKFDTLPSYIDYAVAPSTVPVDDVPVLTDDYAPVDTMVTY